MKRVIFFLICLSGFSAVYAQEPKAEDSVKAAINKLFIGMATSDSAAVLSSFSDNCVFQTINSKDGKESVLVEGLSDFAHIVASSQKSDLDEQIKFNTIKISGPLAFVWAPYNFFYKGKFSHCGIDCFCLARINGKWKIQYLIDTRTKDGCKY